MRVGILTASRTNNNGTDLQTAAMYKLFRKTGNAVEVIDYACKKLDGSRRLLPKRSASAFVRLPWKIFDRLSRESFRKKAFKRSPQTYYPQDLQLDRYDAVVVGSDQIWNLNITGNDLNFFLPENTGSMKRFSYAASLGKTDIRQWEEVFGLKQLLSRFSGVSVRESSGVEALSQIGVEARHDLDPLLCMERSDWEQLAAKGSEKKKYVLLYLVQGSQKAEQAAVAYAKANGFRLYRFGPPQKPTKGMRTRSFVSVPRWIRLMADAQMVFTNSYHGLSAAIALNTDVRVYPLKEQQANTRSLCLLEDLGLQEYFIKEEQPADALPSPDWNRVNAMLQTLRERSMAYIKQMLDL